MRDRDPYPEIGRILASSAPSSWQTLVLTAQVGDDWAKFRAVDVGHDGQQRGLSLQQVARLRDLFIGLRSTTRAPLEPVLEQPASDVAMASAITRSLKTDRSLRCRMIV